MVLFGLDVAPANAYHVCRAYNPICPRSIILWYRHYITLSLQMITLIHQMGMDEYQAANKCKGSLTLTFLYMYNICWWLLALRHTLIMSHHKDNQLKLAKQGISCHCTLVHPQTTFRLRL